MSEPEGAAPHRGHLLMIGTGREIYPKAKDLGYRLSLVCTMKTLATLAGHGIYERVVGMSAEATSEDWAAQVELMGRQDPFDALGGFNELTQHHAAFVARRLGLKYHSEEAIARTRDKHVMREALRLAGVDHTRSAVVGDVQGVASFGDEHGWPVVVKPLDGRASRGVAILASREQAEGLRGELADGAARFVVEEFLDGPEYSVEAFSEGGEHVVVCITEKAKDPETCIETGHCLPARLDDETERAIVELTRAVLTGVGLESGPSHTEVIVTADGPRVVETHARIGGDSIVELVEHAYGVDLDRLWVRQVGGEQVLDEAPGAFRQYAAVAFALPEGQGVVESVEGLEEARDGEGVLKVESLVEPGDEMRGVRDSFDRSAFAVAVASDPAQASERAREAVARVRIEVVDGG